MCNRMDCVNNLGKWIHFQTQWGTHRGIVTDVNNRAVLVRVPRRYAPMGLVSQPQSVIKNDEERLDLALAQWGYRGYGGYARGYGGYGRGWGYPGYGAWGGGWWWWWLAFAWIWWLAFLW